MSELERLPTHQVFGKVAAVQGLLVEVSGLAHLSVGDRCNVVARDGRNVICEVVGFRDGRALVMPFGPLEGLGLGCRAEIAEAAPAVYPNDSWLGRVINGMGKPVDGGGPLGVGPAAYPVKAPPPPAHTRKRVGGKLDLGVRAINTFATSCHGQRMGIFAGSGVGKSTILSMMARYTNADVTVVGLVGERGREAREFIENDLGPEGLARSVVIVATSDQPPLVRLRAGFVATRIAEWFRDEGADVLFLMDSVTRAAMAQREVGLSVGEPPATRGYPPSVFAMLARLLERAGPGQRGSITGLYTVLVEGDDHNEPIADAARSILDGHIVLDRKLATAGHFPSIQALDSISRVANKITTAEQRADAAELRRIMAAHREVRELVEIGAYAA